MKKTIIMGILAATTLLSTGCTDKLEVQQRYEFSISAVPIQAKIGMVESVQMQVKLIRLQKYDGAKYYFSFVQSAGYGFFSDENINKLYPDITYELKGDTLSLNYTSFCLAKQTIEITIRDNFNQEQKLTFNFEHDPNYRRFIKAETCLNRE